MLFSVHSLLSSTAAIVSWNMVVVENYFINMPTTLKPIYILKDAHKDALILVGCKNRKIKKNETKPRSTDIIIFTIIPFLTLILFARAQPPFIIAAILCLNTLM